MNVYIRTVRLVERITGTFTLKLLFLLAVMIGLQQLLVKVFHI